MADGSVRSGAGRKSAEDLCDEEIAQPAVPTFGRFSGTGECPSAQDDQVKLPLQF